MVTLVVGSQAHLLKDYPEFRSAQFFQSLPPEEKLALAGFSNLISFGLGQVLSPRTLGMFPGWKINIHISLLPWNRGSDPNFWSWFDGTPKGVSVHLMEEKPDRGKLLAQREVSMTDSETLYSSYQKLVLFGAKLMSHWWPAILASCVTPWDQIEGGSYHSSADFVPYKSLLGRGWHTPVIEVAALGREHRQAHNRHNDSIR